MPIIMWFEHKHINRGRCTGEYVHIKIGLSNAELDAVKEVSETLLDKLKDIAEGDGGLVAGKAASKVKSLIDDINKHRGKWGARFDYDAPVLTLPDCDNLPTAVIPLDEEPKGK